MDDIRTQTKFIIFILVSVMIRMAAGTGLYMGPYFPSPQHLNITVHQDTSAYLPCTVKQLGDKSVSWVRHRDADILTVDRYTFVRDDRMTVHYTADTETWTLVIKYVQERDAGSYECQVSTEPKMSMLVHLNVIVPQVEVMGAVDKYVRKGSTARLKCMVSSTVQLPDYIFWYHSGERLLEYDHPRVKISVSRRGGQGSEMSITSTLVITNALPKDDGNYTCLPSNLHSATTILHVLDDEHPAAMQTGAAMLTDPPSPWGIILVVLLAFVFVHAHQNLTMSTHITCQRDIAWRTPLSLGQHEETLIQNTYGTSRKTLPPTSFQVDNKESDGINVKILTRRKWAYLKRLPTMTSTTTSSGSKICSMVAEEEGPPANSFLSNPSWIHSFKSFISISFSSQARDCVHFPPMASIWKKNSIQHSKVSIQTVSQLKIIIMNI